MQQAVRYDGWSIITGMDFREKLVIRDPTQEKISNPDYDKCDPQSQQKIYPPKDLTDWDAKMDIRVGNGSNTGLVKSLSVGSGITIGTPDPVDGTIELFIDNTETKSAPIIDSAGKSVYFDLFLIPPTPADNQRVIYGSIKIIQAVTDV